MLLEAVSETGSLSLESLLPWQLPLDPWDPEDRQTRSSSIQTRSHIEKATSTIATARCHTNEAAERNLGTC